MKLILTEAALDDLRSIRDCTLETWGSGQEELYLKKLWSKIELIQGEPSNYRLRDDLFLGCRIAAEGRHIILFLATEDSLKIVRVLHSAMNFKRHVPFEDD